LKEVKIKMSKTNYAIKIDYTEYKPLTYKGVVLLKKDSKGKLIEIFRSNTGFYFVDECRCINQPYVVNEGINYLSSYDDYISDFECLNPILKFICKLNFKRIERKIGWENK
jgi:hypothetical protein